MVKQRLWNSEYSRTKIRNNILKVYNLCQPEDLHDWYGEALEACMQMAGSSHDHTQVNKACGVVAALSPRLHWQRNLTEARSMWSTRECKQIGTFKKKALDIMDSSGTDEAILRILNGNKISAFYQNIRYPDKAISLTIDRHMLSVCLGKKLLEADLKSLSNTQYKFLEDCVRWTAAGLDINPLLLQSATWVRWRKLKH